MRRDREGGVVGRRVSVIAAVVLLVSAAGVLGCQRANPGGDLKGRVTKYWQLKQSKAWPQVYDEYLDPNAKGQLTKDAFVKRRFLAFDILSFEVGEVEQDGDKATVEVTNEANIPLKSPNGEMQFIKKQVTTKDTWVRRDGTWFVELKE
jgi:hypothetical protein